MFKQLLSFAAAAVVSLGASADVLWQSETEKGVLVVLYNCYIVCLNSSLQSDAIIPLR